MFTAIQYEFTRYVRDPEGNPAPMGMEDRRMQIYRDLLYRNVEGFIANSFPVLRRITPDDKWHNLIRDYFKNHRAQTPLFPKMPQEFLRYLEQERTDHPEDPPWLLELAHYEWIETSLAIDPREMDFSDIGSDGNLLEGVPVLSPLALPLAYNWPVHKIGPEYQPDIQPAEPTWIVVYRRCNDDVGFMVLNAVSARLIELIQSSDSKTGRELLLQIATELKHPEPDVVILSGMDILQELRDKDIVQGVQRDWQKQKGSRQ